VLARLGHGARVQRRQWGRGQRSGRALDGVRPTLRNDEGGLARMQPKFSPCRTRVRADLSALLQCKQISKCCVRGVKAGPDCMMRSYSRSQRMPTVGFALPESYGEGEQLSF